MGYILIIISAVFVNNIVLNRFLGICPFIGVSSRINTAIGMTGAVTFVMVIATLVTYLIHEYVLLPHEITFMRTITFILVIASLVQLVEIILKKISPPLYQALGIYLPLITTNCAILGVAVLAVEKSFVPDLLIDKYGLEYNLPLAVTFAAANALGFGLALVLFSGIREQLDLLDIPKGMKGVPIAFIVAGLLALAFMGFAGIV